MWSEACLGLGCGGRERQKQSKTAGRRWLCFLLREAPLEHGPGFHPPDYKKQKEILKENKAWGVWKGFKAARSPEVIPLCWRGWGAGTPGTSSNFPCFPASLSQFSPCCLVTALDVLVAKRSWWTWRLYVALLAGRRIQGVLELVWLVWFSRSITQVCRGVELLGVM